MPAFSVSGGDGAIARYLVPTDSIKITHLKDTEFADIPVYVPDGRTLKIWMWGARTASQTTPANLTVSLYDYGSAATVKSASTPHTEGEPIATLAGPVDASLRLTNQTGGAVDAGAVFSTTLEG